MEKISLIRTAAAYLRSRSSTVLACAGFLAVFTLVQWLYGLSLEPTLYAAALCSALALALGARGFLRYYRKHAALRDVLLNTENDVRPLLPEERNLIESDYRQLACALEDERAKLLFEYDSKLDSLTDYYTMWAHQIKTPLSAMRLLLKAERSADWDALMEGELFVTERCVDMALNYIRIENMASDLLIKEHCLDSIVRSVIKKYAVIFIRKDVKLELAELKRTVVTDEKWFALALEQLVSNALKYTDKGRICVYTEGAESERLVVEDTGAGIVPQDLPRIFERGYTGSNGRSGQRSTGMGLFMCKKALEGLGMRVEAQSGGIGAGARFTIELGPQ